MYIAIHELLNNCASHYSYCGVDCSDLCAHMLQNDRKEEFLRILQEPHNALTLQYTALMATEGVQVTFQQDALEEVAAFAEETNRQTENIGARRLYTILEKILADLSFEAPERSGDVVSIDRAWVRERLADVRNNADLTRFIL